jgi:hypothetical protein
VEDSQNDWFRSTQRATEGSHAAEVDGKATDATLTLATVVDLTGFASATLTFDWLIESGFDAGEYVSLDISTNGGSTWQTDVRRLSGNVSQEDVWHSETVDLTGYASASVLIRFRSKVSASDEDANVDNVRIVASAASSGAGSFASFSAPPSEATDLQLSDSIESTLVMAATSAEAPTTSAVPGRSSKARLSQSQVLVTSLSSSAVDSVFADFGSLLDDNLSADLLSPQLSRVIV